MHRHFIVFLVASIAVGCGTGLDEPAGNSAVVLDDADSPAVNAEAPAGETEDIAAFFARFKSTVRANDAEAVANMAEFPFEMDGITREQFLSEYYTSTFGEGEFRESLLAGSPAALRDDGDGRYSFSALVAWDCGDLEEEFDCESAAVFYFGRNGEGHWRLVDMMFAG